MTIKSEQNQPKKQTNKQTTDKNETKTQQKTMWFFKSLVILS